MNENKRRINNLGVLKIKQSRIDILSLFGLKKYLLLRNQSFFILFYNMGIRSFVLTINLINIYKPTVLLAQGNFQIQLL